MLTRPLLALLLLLGCDPGTPTSDAAVPILDPILELGTGEGTFNTFEDGQTLDLVSGCQGLQHVWVAMRGQGVDPRGTLVVVSLRRASDGVMVNQVFEVRISMRPVDEMPGIYQLYGLTLIVPTPEDAIGQDLLLSATVTDRNGVVIADERPVRVDWGAGGCL
ncbi:MAG: hypothetical protein KC619_07270 [Myxococcales bacterium]|nr:hypothetical protein [Myxococcales bacterium]